MLPPIFRSTVLADNLVSSINPICNRSLAQLTKSCGGSAQINLLPNKQICAALSHNFIVSIAKANVPVFCRGLASRTEYLLIIFRNKAGSIFGPPFGFSALSQLLYIFAEIYFSGECFQTDRFNKLHHHFSTDRIFTNTDDILVIHRLKIYCIHYQTVTPIADSRKRAGTNPNTISARSTPASISSSAIRASVLLH